MSLHLQHFYTFDGFTIDAEQRVLLQSGYRVQLTPKALDILLALVQRSGQVVDKETLMREVWPDTFVEDINLAYNIHVLRKALGASNGSRGEYIETIPKRGYRFVQSVCETRGDPDVTEETPGRAVQGKDMIAGARPSFQKRLGFLTFLMVTVAAVLIVLGYSNRLKENETASGLNAALASLPGPSADVESRAKKILQMLIDEKFSDVAGRFDRNLSRSLTPRQMRQVWSEMKQRAGVFKRILDVSLAKDEGFEVVDIRCQFEGARMVLRVAFNANAEIGGLWLLSANSTPPGPASSETNSSTTEDLKRVTHDVVDKLAGQDFEGITKAFDNALRSKISAQQIQREWQSIIAQAGPFKRIVDIQRDYDIVNARLQCKRTFVDLRVEFNAQRTISGLFVRLSSN